MLTYLQCIYTGPDVIFCLVTQGQQCVQICPQTLRLCYLSMQIQENSNFSQYWIDLKINFYFCTYLIIDKWIYFHLWGLFLQGKAIIHLWESTGQSGWFSLRKINHQSIHSQLSQGWNIPGKYRWKLKYFNGCIILNMKLRLKSSNNISQENARSLIIADTNNGPEKNALILLLLFLAWFIWSFHKIQKNVDDGLQN